MVRLVFFGTHEFAATILGGLLDNPLFEVCLVITQPDRPAGRKQELQPSPVKLLAQKYNIPIEQPAKLTAYSLQLKANIGIVAQYGLLIPKHILDFFPLGIINVHTSLLPKYRGASPIQSALINGETETGVTIMKMDQGLDTGPIILQKKASIESDETYFHIDKKLAELGILALNEALPRYISGELIPVPQDNAQATICKEFTRDEGKINWHKTALQIYNQYRGLTPWPGVWTTWNEKRIKIISMKIIARNLPPGQVEIFKNQLFVGTTKDAIEVTTIQIEGKTAATTTAFILGNSSIHGYVFG
ncbi:MAG: methionyl-tRNA formyltransferase [Candidatus Magasanikbacteria bacterium]|nr:methionyl-tRNA formyltransferase [Candidatus Magasanikbacteria bacterium]